MGGRRMVLSEKEPALQSDCLNSILRNHGEFQARLTLVNPSPEEVEAGVSLGFISQGIVHNPPASSQSKKSCQRKHGQLLGIAPWVGLCLE